jgi:hypothetical protein
VGKKRDTAKFGNHPPLHSDMPRHIRDSSIEGKSERIRHYSHRPKCNEIEHAERHTATVNLIRRCYKTLVADSPLCDGGSFCGKGTPTSITTCSRSSLVKQSRPEQSTFSWVADRSTSRPISTATTVIPQKHNTIYYFFERRRMGKMLEYIPHSHENQKDKNQGESETFTPQACSIV